MRRHTSTCAGILAIALAGPAAAVPHRAVWFWNQTSVGGSVSPHSSSIVVGDPAKEDNAIQFMTCHGVKEVYGSYSTRPANESDPDGAPAIRAWNAKLDAAGIESQLLISGPEPGSEPSPPTAPGPLTDPDHVSWVNKVLSRLVDFNNGCTTAAQKFDALHLDLEPQSLDHWKLATTTNLERRAYLDDLLDAFIDIRAALDGAGFTGLPIYVDLPWNWHKMPAPDPEDGKVGWSGPTDRDAWFAALGAVVDGMSVMTFTASKDTLPEIADATSYERTGPFGKPARVAIQPKVGPGEIWPDYPTFSAIVSGLETEPEVSYGTADLENYAFWRHAWADYGPLFDPCLPSLEAADAPEIIAPSPGTGTGGVIGFTGSPGYLYQVKHSNGLDGDYEPSGTLRTRGGVRERITTPVSFDGPRGFWAIEEIDPGVQAGAP